MDELEQLIKLTKKATADINRARRILERRDTEVPLNMISNFPQFEREVKRARGALEYVEGYVEREYEDA